MKFKVGDKVKILDGLAKGEIGKVKLVDTIAYLYDVSVDGVTYFLKEEDLELIKEPIFNKGNLTPHKIEKTDPIVEKVRQKLLDRSRLGIKKYGTTLEENNTDDFLVHALEEAMDLALYLQKEIDNRK